MGRSIDINSIGYGNVSQGQLERAKIKRTLWRDFEPERIPYPLNSSPEAFGELLYLKQLQEQHADTSFLEFVEVADEDMYGLFEALLASVGEPFEYYHQLFQELVGFTIVLKMEYDRCRPYQLASMLGVELHPMSSESAHSPSYPSGHTLQTLTVAGAIARNLPEIADKAIAIGKAIAVSRMVGGYHYPSDNAYSEVLARQVLENLR